MGQGHSIAVIGAGPAGLFAADILSAAGCNVTVYDRKPSAARKFLMAGRGGLNITHSEPLDIFLTRYGDARSFLEPMIRAFAPDDLRAWCHDLGQETFIGTSGRVFPRSMKASPLLRAWLARLNDRGVLFHFNRLWSGWDDDGALRFEGGETIKPDAVLLALGGASWPGLGSDGSWRAILETKHIRVTPFAPSNGGFVVPWSDYFKTRFAGQPLKNIRLAHDGRDVAGEIMITESGIEGGAVYALSPPLRDAIAARGSARIAIDLHPHMTADVLVKKLSAPRGRQSFSTFMRKTLNLPPAAIALLHETDADIAGRPAPETARTVKECSLSLTAAFPMDRAISSAGGIALSALDSGLMLKNMPGVFAAGEMLDWEAPTGGYLLQASFATGRAAAVGILDWLDRR